jgi:hypothetical protein
MLPSQVPRNGIIGDWLLGALASMGLVLLIEDAIERIGGQV